MFAERFDALMNIAELSNSRLGREISMNPSHIGRLRSGARPLPKRHEFLPGMCGYLASHIQKDYQLIALQKLTGITGAAAVLSYTKEQYALHIERLRHLEKQYENLCVRFRSDVAGNTVLYIKEDTGVIMAKIDAPMSAFVFNDPSMINAFWDYLA